MTAKEVHPELLALAWELCARGLELEHAPALELDDVKQPPFIRWRVEPRWEVVVLHATLHVERFFCLDGVEEEREWNLRAAARGMVAAVRVEEGKLWSAVQRLGCDGGGR